MAGCLAGWLVHLCVVKHGEERRKQGGRGEERRRSVTSLHHRFSFMSWQMDISGGKRERKEEKSVLAVGKEGKKNTRD